MGRLLVCAALMAAGCFSPKYENGRLKCASGDKPCPDGYHCAIDTTCWKDGEDPDLAQPFDLGIAFDLAPSPPDFTIPDGNHLGHAETAEGGAIKVQATGTHSITLSIGQKVSGQSKAAGSHSIQFGILSGTTSK